MAGQSWTAPEWCVVPLQAAVHASMPGPPTLQELQARYDDGSDDDAAHPAQQAAAPGGWPANAPGGAAPAVQQPQPHVSAATAAAAEAELLGSPEESDEDDEDAGDDSDLELQDYLELHDGGDAPDGATKHCCCFLLLLRLCRCTAMLMVRRSRGSAGIVAQTSGTAESAPLAAWGRAAGAPISSCGGAPRSRRPRRCSRRATARRCGATSRGPSHAPCRGCHCHLF